MRAVRRLTRAESAVSLAVVAGAVLFVLSQLHPALLVSTTTPAGGDTGAHVWGPAFLRDHLLPDWRLTGWAPAWYAGFPAFHFYMVVPSLLVVALDAVLPYTVAFKLVTVAGPLALPVAAWGFGRLTRVPFPGPPLLALATVPFLFDRSFTIYGGNLASTLAGEFAFSISLALAVVYLGVVARGLQAGPHRALAAGLLAACGLCHIIPAFFALAGTALWLLLRPGWWRVRWLLGSGVVAGLLGAFWVLPFVWRRGYMTDMGWEKRTAFVEMLFPGRLGVGLSRALHVLGGGGEPTGVGTAGVPGDLTWATALAALGAILVVHRRRLPGVYLVLLAVVSAAAFVLVPQGRLWNARLLPFWYLCVYLLAGLAVAEVARSAAAAARRWPQLARRVPTGGLVAAALATLVVVGMPLRALPFGTERVLASGATSYEWMGLTTTDRSYVPDWARWNYSGYEAKQAWPEYRDLVRTMADVGRGHGCGRAMWEYEADLDRYGTPMAPMLLPYWTDGCIGSMEGLYFEASATTPYHFLNQSLLSLAPSRAMRDLPYRGLDVARGVEHLQLLGVRYYLAFSEPALAAARDHPDLTFLARTGPWEVFEVAGAEMVEPLEALPAVVTGVETEGRPWLDTAASWYVDADRGDVFLAADGPPSWPRVAVDRHAGAAAAGGGGEPRIGEAVTIETPAVRPVAPVTVTDVEAGTDRIAFTVDEPGTPVLVKASYFPNWQASGADGPWRVTPNLMVVVPTDRQVVLTYGITSVDALAWSLTVAGLVGLVVLARRPARRGSDGESGDEDEGAPADGVRLAADDDGVLAGAPLAGRAPVHHGGPVARTAPVGGAGDDDGGRRPVPAFVTTDGALRPDGPRDGRDDDEPAAPGALPPPPVRRGRWP